LGSDLAAGSFETLTHARLRAGQGDVSGAVRILRVLLRVDPDHSEARRLLAELQGRPTVSAAEPVASPLLEPAVASASELSGRFRAALDRRGAPDARTRRDRLETWLVRVVARRGVRRVR
jgi:hypothetical protein